MEEFPSPSFCYSFVRLLPYISQAFFPALPFLPPPPPNFSCTSPMTPRVATATPAHSQRRQNLTVLHDAQQHAEDLARSRDHGHHQGSKLAMVKKMDDWPMALQKLNLTTMGRRSGFASRKSSPSKNSLLARLTATATSIIARFVKVMRS